MGELEKIIEAQKEYIALLVAELEEVVPIAANHHWKSSRYEAGVIARNKIEILTKNMNGVRQGDQAFRKTSWDLKALLALPLDERNKILEDAAEKGAHLYAWAEVKP